MKIESVQNYAVVIVKKHLNVSHFKKKPQIRAPQNYCFYFTTIIMAHEKKLGKIYTNLKWRPF